MFSLFWHQLLIFDSNVLSSLKISNKDTHKLMSWLSNFVILFHEIESLIKFSSLPVGNGASSQHGNGASFYTYRLFETI